MRSAEERKIGRFVLIRSRHQIAPFPPRSRCQIEAVYQGFRPIFEGLTRNKGKFTLPVLIGTEVGKFLSAGVQFCRRGSEFRLTEIKLKKGESVEKALRRLKKKIDREGTLKEVRNHRHYEKPSEKKRRKMKVARFSAMLSARYADL